MNEKMTIRGVEYLKYVNEDGRDCLKRYDNEYKMWIELVFSNEDHGVREYLMNELSEKYIKRTALSL